MGQAPKVISELASCCENSESPVIPHLFHVVIYTFSIRLYTFVYFRTSSPVNLHVSNQIFPSGSCFILFSMPGFPASRVILYFYSTRLLSFRARFHVFVGMGPAPRRVSSKSGFGKGPAARADVSSGVVLLLAMCIHSLDKCMNARVGMSKKQKVVYASRVKYRCTYILSKISSWLNREGVLLGRRLEAVQERVREGKKKNHLSFDGLLFDSFIFGKRLQAWCSVPRVWSFPSFFPCSHHRFFLFSGLLSPSFSSCYFFHLDCMQRTEAWR